MTPQELKNSILQLAIQDKLVEQRAEEGTGRELLEKILAERYGTNETRGTNGTAKTNGTKRRASSVSEVSSVSDVLNVSGVPSDEKPFDIPESWEWVRLGEIGSWASGATPSRTHSEYYGGSIPWLKTGDLTDGYVSSIPEFITDLALEKNSVRLNPVGSVLMAMYGATIGKLGILQIAATTNQACCACIPYDGVWNKYLFYYLMARRKAFIKMGEGGAQPNISKEKMVNALIPLLPLAEQKRIVAKIEELLPLIDRYEKAWSRLKDFNKRFPIDMQKSLLQMAIQGKLVEQRADEGTGAELLEKILAAKNAKVAKGRGEKSHAKSAKSAKVGACVSREEIPDDEKTFDIPESWEWVRLESIVNSVPSKQYQILESEVRTSGKFAVISQSKEYSIGFTDISEKVYHHVNPVIVFGDHTTEVKYVEFDFVVGADGVKIFEPLDGLLLAKYLFYVLLFNTYDLSKVGGYSRHYKFLKNKPIPLPPLAEQKRIVAKLEELLPLCERLKSESNSAANS